MALGSPAGFWYLSTLSRYFVHATALDGTRMEIAMLEEVIAFYNEIAERVDGKKTPVTHRYAKGRRMNVPREDAADVFQEVFQAVALHVETFRNERPGDTFRGWLRTITRNKVLDYFRLEERQPKAAGGTAAKIMLTQIPDPEGDDERPEDVSIHRHMLHRALQAIQAEFQERTWRAFWGMVVDGQTAQEVAEVLRMTPGAVRVAKCRVLNRLRRELGDLEL
jgi:RNA polymerase sigma-70 factor (ECF subfamily)